VARTLNADLEIRNTSCVATLQSQSAKRDDGGLRLVSEGEEPNVAPADFAKICDEETRLLLAT
jgi:hypothetical protein